MRRCVAFFVSIAVDVAMFRYEPGPQQPVAYLLTPRILHCGSLHCKNVRKDDSGPPRSLLRDTVVTGSVPMSCKRVNVIGPSRKHVLFSGRSDNVYTLVTKLAQAPPNEMP